MINVALTPSIRAQLSTILGNGFDESKIAVFEYVALGSEPLKASRPFNGAKTTANLMNKLTQLGIQRPVPFIEMHQSSYTLPQGRTFMTKTYTDAAGENHLHGLAYFDDPAVISKIQTGIYRDVSVGYGVSSAKCSACGFDFMGSDMGKRSLMEYRWGWTEQLECVNNHVMNENGVHIWLDDAGYWDEVSLVTRGASETARFLSPQFHKLALENFQTIPLAASQSNGTLSGNASLADFKVISNVIVDENKDFLGSKPNPPQGNKDMSATVPLEVHTTLAQKNGQLESQLEAAKADVIKLQADIVALQAKANAHDKVAGDLEAEKTAKATLQTQYDELKTKCDAFQTRLTVLNQLDADGKPKADPAGNEQKPDQPSTTVVLSQDPALYTRTK